MRAEKGRKQGIDHAGYMCIFFVCFGVTPSGAGAKGNYSWEYVFLFGETDRQTAQGGFGCLPCMQLTPI